jgi:hypothetical protein
VHLCWYTLHIMEHVCVSDVGWAGGHHEGSGH